jgi:4-amino-4-deoxy-L-arabinose transferase-like glycosyltransferase
MTSTGEPALSDRPQPHEPPAIETPPAVLARWMNARTWPVFVFAALIALAFVGLRWPLWGDEYHFLDTVRLFCRRPLLQLLPDYPEVTPPLAFVLYRGWAALFGQSTEALRSLSLVLAAGAWILAYRLLRRLSRDEWHAWWMALVFVANPYVIGTSVFVFTDMAALLFTLGAARALIGKRVVLFGVLSACAVLSRHYAVVLPIAVLAAGLVQALYGEKVAKGPLVAAALSVVPLGALMLLWHGVAPPSGMKLWFIPNLAPCNPSSLTAYLTFGALYALPLVVWHLRHRRWSRTDIFVIVTALAYYALLPIEPSAASITQGQFDTVGLAHRATFALLGHGVVARWFLGLVFVMGMLVTRDLVGRFLRRSRAAEDVPPFVWAIWPVFLVLMSFSYQVWEKYLIQVQPFVMGALFALDRTRGRS